MAVLLDEKYLIEQTDDNKDYIFKRIKEQIAKNKKKYPNIRFLNKNTSNDNQK